MLSTIYNCNVRSEFKRIEPVFDLFEELGLNADNSVVVGSLSLYLRGTLIRDRVDLNSDLDLLVCDHDIYDDICSRWGVVSGHYPEFGPIVRVDLMDENAVAVADDTLRYVEFMSRWPIERMTSDYIFNNASVLNGLRLMNPKDAIESLHKFGRSKDIERLNEISPLIYL